MRNIKNMRNIGYDSDNKCIDAVCTNCGKVFHIPATAEQYERIANDKEYIQCILPKTTAGERELFISGWCGCCFDLETMYFPKKALDELGELASKELDCDIHLKNNKDVIALLQELEETDDTGVEDYIGAVQRIRDKIEKLADRIDDGEFDEEDEE